METTANFHNEIAHPYPTKTHAVLEHATAFDTTVDVFDTDPAGGECPIFCLLFVGQLPTTGFAMRGAGGHAFQRESQKAEILQQDTACWEGIGERIGDLLIMDGADHGWTEIQDMQMAIDQQDVFDGVTFFLAAIMAFLFISVLGTGDAPFSPIVAKRGGIAGGRTWCCICCSKVS